MPRKIKIKKRAAKSSSKDSNGISLEPGDFDYELTPEEVDSLNLFCNQEIKLKPDGTTPLEESVRDELELASEYAISSVEGFKDWLALTAAFGWRFIKQNDFAEVEQRMAQTGSADNETQICALIIKLAKSL